MGSECRRATPVANWLAPARVACLVLVAAACLAGSERAHPADGDPPYITLGSTTSTRDSGLLAHLAPMFEAESGIAVRVVAVGTGRALEYGRRGDVDVLLVHHRPSEERFVADGYAPYRRDVMYNDFVFVGPADDPAGLRSAATAKQALAKIAGSEARFLSRGDDSGTHKAERGLWANAGIEPRDHSGAWYLETGSGMGATLNTAAEMGAYALTDRGTWLSFANRRGLELLFHGDPPLRNPYGILPIDPDRHPHVKFEAAERFIAWLTSETGRAAIEAFRVGGEPLFFVDRSHSAEAGAASD